MRCLDALQRALGYVFRDESLLRLALTHPSAGEKADNQRLEFLGDAVLQLCVSVALYRQHPSDQEGGLTFLRQALVREETLAVAARRFGLGECLLFDRGEAASGGRDKPSVLADAMEAVLAAVYLDGGLDAASALCARALDDFRPPQQTEKNWKSLLQESAQALGHPAPVYRVAGEEGPPHARVFTAEALLNGRVVGRGQGGSKKQAEQEAARDALKQNAKKTREAIV